MPSYATIADMRARIVEADLIELTDDDHTGAVDEARILTAIGQADAEIDGYVGRYYRRIDGVTPVPAALVDIACDIAHYRLFRFSTVTDLVAQRYKDAVTKLDRITNGKFTLDQGEEKLPARDGQILVDSAERTFTRDSMRAL